VNQDRLGRCDRLFDGVKLLGDIEASTVRLDHLDDVPKVALGALEALGHISMGLVEGFGVHCLDLSWGRGYVNTHAGFMSTFS